jgi:putative NADH-flavin reductase
MKVVVFGPTGKTGEQLVQQALDAGHQVTAVARRPEAISLAHPRLEVLPGDVLDPAWMGAGMERADAVLSALGSRELGKPTTLYSVGTTAILSAMAANEVTRFIGISATPVGPHEQESLLERWLVYPLLRRFFGPGYDDMRRMEVILAASQSEWTMFRPPRLTNGPLTGKCRTAIGRRLPRAWNLSRSDLAAAMIGVIGDPVTVRMAITIAK